MASNTFTVSELVVTSQIMMGIRTLFSSSDHSDIKIMLDSVTVPAHLLILSIHTPYFAKAVDPSSGFEESGSRIIKLSSEYHDLRAVWLALKYCYTGEYDLDGENNPFQLDVSNFESTDIRQYTSAYVTANFFQIKTLESLSSERIQYCLDDGRVDVGMEDFVAICNDIFPLAVAAEDEKLQMRLAEYASRFMEADRTQRIAFLEKISGDADFLALLFDAHTRNTVRNTQAQSRIEARGELDLKIRCGDCCGGPRWVQLECGNPRCATPSTLFMRTN